MSRKEDMDKLNSLLAEVNALAEKINKEYSENAIVENTKPDVLAGYKSISVDNPNGIQINPNPPSLIAPTNTLPIKIDAEIPFPEFRKFISEYMKALQEKIPTRIDNVIVHVEIVPTVHTHTPYELQDEDSMEITTYYRLYNVIDRSKCRFNTYIHISALQIKHYIESAVHEWEIHCIDVPTIMNEIVKFAKGLHKEEKNR